MSPLSRIARISVATSIAAASIGCGGVVPMPRSSLKGASDASPLGPSYVLLPLPSDDDALLGRVLPDLPAAGHSLEETARPNPCAEKLTPAKETPLSNTFEDAQELAVGAKAKAMLGIFGFSGDAEHATHFVYKLETSKRAARTDTTEYVACCKEKGCGYGYVSALIYGEGEYATGEEGKASGSAEVGVSSVGGSTRLKILHKRKVHGFIAAVVTVTDEKQSEKLGPLGVASAAGITEASIPQTVKVLYEKDKISVDGSGDLYSFKDGRGALITENDFVRRFRAVNTTDELDDVETRRNKVSFVVAGSLTAISVGAALFGFLNLQRGCTPSDYDPDFKNDCSGGGATGNSGGSSDPFGSTEYLRTAKTSNPLGLGLAIGGSVGTLGFGIWFLSAALGYDGNAKSHYLTDHDAILLSDRYNRALLRKTIREVETSHQSSRLETPRPSFAVSPFVGPGVFGVNGKF